jgi:hypothetical protein
MPNSLMRRENQSGELQATNYKEPGDEVAIPQVIEIIESIRQIVDVVVVEGQDFETLHASHLGREFGELVLVQVQLGKRQKLLEGMKASAKALPYNESLPAWLGWRTYAANLGRERCELVVVEEEAREASELPVVRTNAVVRREYDRSGALGGSYPISGGNSFRRLPPRLSFLSEVRLPISAGNELSMLSLKSSSRKFTSCPAS